MGFEDYKSEYYEALSKDLLDLKLLRKQREGQLILILAFIFEYTATEQAIEIVKDRINLREGDFLIGKYLGEANERLKYGLEEQEFKNKNVDADETALKAAYLEVLGQSILTKIDCIKLSRFNQNTLDKDYLIAKTANEEIFIGAVLGELSFLFNLQGVLLLYETSNENPLND